MTKRTNNMFIPESAVIQRKAFHKVYTFQEDNSANNFWSHLQFWIGNTPIIKECEGMK